MSVTTQNQNKFVAFRLVQEYYCIDVQRVSEVFVPSGSITPIPNAPDHVAGVINFRGSIVSVIDLKKRLSISAGPKKTSEDDEFEEDRIYVVIVKNGDSTIGLQVDYVESVLTIDQQNIQSTLDLISSTQKSAFIEGVARTDLGLTVILSLNTILAEYDAKEVEKLAAIREQLSVEQDSDEVVVTNETLVDLDEDDIDEMESVGSSPLDLNLLSKAELIKIAMDLEIEGVGSKTTKADLVEKINEKMG